MTPSLSNALLRAQSDRRLAALAGQGSERAFEVLVGRYRGELLRFVRALLRGRAPHADDALQQALVSAWQALRAGSEVSDVRAWLYRATHNAALRQVARSRDEVTLFDLPGAEDPHSELEQRLAARAALAGLAELPELQRDALMLTALEGRSYDEVASRLGVSSASVRGLVHRARTTLRAAATVFTPAPLAGWAAGLGSGAVVVKGGAVAGGLAAVIAGGAAVMPAGDRTSPRLPAPAPPPAAVASPAVAAPSPAPRRSRRVSVVRASFERPSTRDEVVDRPRARRVSERPRSRRRAVRRSPPMSAPPVIQPAEPPAAQPEPELVAEPVVDPKPAAPEPEPKPPAAEPDPPKPEPEPDPPKEPQPEPDPPPREPEPDPPPPEEPPPDLPI